MLEGTNWIDVIICGIILVSILLGILQGLLYSISGVLSFVSALVTAYMAGDLLEGPMQAFTDNALLAPFFSVAAVFLGVFISVKVLLRLASAGLRKADLGGLDKAGGIVYGFVRGGVFSMVFVVGLAFASVDKTLVWWESRTVPLAGVALKHIKPFMGEYGHWLTFDQKNRPQLAHASELKEPPEDEESENQQRVQVPQVADDAREGINWVDKVKGWLPKDAVKALDKKEKENQRFESVMEELRNYVAVRSAHTPDADKIFHEESKSVKELELRLVCMMRNNKNCENIQLDQLSQTERKELNQLRGILACKIEKRDNCGAK